MKTKVPYISILITVFLLSLLIAIIPFSEKKGLPEEKQAPSKQGATGRELSASGIITESLRAHGGADLLAALRSLGMRASSVLLGQGQEVAEESAVYRFPEGMRSEAKIGNDVYVQGYFRSTAWTRTGGEVRDADTGTTELLRRSLKHFPNILLYALDPAAVTLMRGTTFIDGKPYHTLSIIDAESDETILCISAEDFLIHRMEYSVFAGVTEELLRLDFRDFRAHAGVSLPHQVDITMNGMRVQETKIDKYELNLPLPDSLFEKPRE